MAEEPRIHDPANAEVRPRLVWGGAAVAVVGVCATGLAMMSRDPWLSWGGGALALAGLLTAWRGGIVHNTRGQEPPHHEFRELVDGGRHQGISPDARVVAREAQARAAALTERKEQVLTRSRTASRGSLRPMAAILLTAVGAWLLIGQWVLGYPFTVAGQDNALRDVGFGVIVVLCALRLRLPSRSRLSVALCLLSGCLLILSALFLAHDSRFVRLDEVITGAALLGLTGLMLRKNPTVSSGRT